MDYDKLITMPLECTDDSFNLEVTLYPWKGPSELRRPCHWVYSCPRDDGYRLACVNCPAHSEFKECTFNAAVNWWKAGYVMLP